MVNALGLAARKVETYIRPGLINMSVRVCVIIPGMTPGSTALGHESSHVISILGHVWTVRRVIWYPFISCLPHWARPPL